MTDPTVITIELPADFEGEATFAITPNPEPEPPTNPAEPSEA